MCGRDLQTDVVLRYRAGADLFTLGWLRPFRSVLKIFLLGGDDFAFYFYLNGGTID